MTISLSSFVNSIPSGAIMPFAMNTAPTGWLVCDGSQYSTTTYASLFAAIGTTYGSGSGTFGVPNLQGIFIRGSGTQTQGGVAYTSGTFGAFQADQLQDHTHGYSSSLAQISITGGGGNSASNTPSSYTTSSPSGRSGTDTRPANIAMLYCIKT